MTRHIDLHGVDNFRDFGGYATACGRGLKRGLLYRSANHAHATPADLETMGALGVSVVVDLRRVAEREREPSRRWAGFVAHVVENDIGGEDEDWAAGLRDVHITPEWFRADGIGFYRKAPYEPRHVELFSRYFRALAETDGAVIVHCAAGKDRTGLICALTHHVAGVSREDMLDDYLLTNDPDRITRRAQRLITFIDRHVGKTLDEATARIAVSVDPAYLDAAFETIDNTHGGLDGYLEAALGLDAQLRERVRERILA